VKKAITFLLALSLYAPHMAKLLAYADCTYQRMSNEDPRLCDCNKIVDLDALPIVPDQPDKQKEISIKADWKYTVFGYCRENALLPQLVKSRQASPFIYMPLVLGVDIFHPPQLNSIG
jgi:hypothetical protein